MYCVRVSLSQLVSAAPYRVAAYQETQGEPSGSRATEDDILACSSSRTQDNHAYLARACIAV
jgi:hypothetical protein